MFRCNASGGRIDWQSERDRIDLVGVVAGLLGPAPGRRGERGRKLWWHCPLHDDGNPSFVVDPGKPWWKCFGCGEHGDAADLVMRLEGLTFPEAVRRLVGGFVPSGPPRPKPAPRPATPAAPSGLPAPEALALVESAEARLWSPEGAEALAYLTGPRGLSPETIRAARLGWTPGVEVPTRKGAVYTARGVTIPWFDGGRLALVKLRQPDGSWKRYVEAFRDRPGVYFGHRTGRAGSPLVVVEGDFDAILLGQDLAGLATVATLGSASIRPDPAIMDEFLSLAPWYVATDADEAGDKAAAKWPPPRSRRARPPGRFKDWTEARQGGIDLRRWWTDRLAGNEAPALFTWPELAAMRWGPAEGDPSPGIVIDRPGPARRRAALDALETHPSDPDDPDSWPIGRE